PSNTSRTVLATARRAMERSHSRPSSSNNSRQTFNGYAMSQFKKIEQDIRNSGEIKWKHAMHLLRLLLTGAATLREGRVPVRVEAHRDRLLAVKRGGMPWPEVDAWRKELHRDFERALVETKLHERQ